MWLILIFFVTSYFVFRGFTFNLFRNDSIFIFFKVMDYHLSVFTSNMTSFMSSLVTIDPSMTLDDIVFFVIPMIGFVTVSFTIDPSVFLMNVSILIDAIQGLVRVVSVFPGFVGSFFPNRVPSSTSRLILISCSRLMTQTGRGRLHLATSNSDSRFSRKSQSGEQSESSKLFDVHLILF